MLLHSVKQSKQFRVRVLLSLISIEASSPIEDAAFVLKSPNLKKGRFLVRLSSCQYREQPNGWSEPGFDHKEYQT